MNKARRQANKQARRQASRYAKKQSMKPIGTHICNVCWYFAYKAMLFRFTDKYHYTINFSCVLFSMDRVVYKLSVCDMADWYINNDYIYVYFNRVGDAGAMALLGKAKDHFSTDSDLKLVILYIILHI